MSAQLYCKNTKLSKTSRTSFLNKDSALRLQIGIRACEQIKKFGRTILKKDGEESFPITNPGDVARFLGLHPETLRRHLTDQRDKYLKKTENTTGPRCLLGKSLENELCNYIVWMDERGFPLPWHKVTMAARELAIAHNISNFMASAGWMDGFKKRHAFT